MYIVSACLAGIKCRYDGNDFMNEQVAALVESGQALPVCPEMLGGLPSPRACCEIQSSPEGDRVVTRDGEDITHAFVSGAEKACKIADIAEASCAILKSGSPSCGYGLIYDGTFSGNKKSGKGIAAAMMEKAGMRIITDEQTDLIDALISSEDGE